MTQNLFNLKKKLAALNRKYFSFNFKERTFTLLPIDKFITILTVMLFFAIFIFASEFLPFNEEVVVISCVFFAFLCIDTFAGQSFRDFFSENINDITNLADKNMEEVKAILAVKGSQEIKCNYSLTKKKIFIYNLFVKIVNADDFFNTVIFNDEKKTI